MAEQHQDPIQYREPPFHVTLWRAAATGTALFLLYSMVAHVVRMGAMLGGQRMADTTRQAGEVVPGEVGVSVSIPVAGEVADPIRGCIVLGIIVYLVLTWCASRTG